MVPELEARIRQNLERAKVQAAELRKAMEHGLTVMAGCHARGHVIKTCGCGREYTLVTWLELPYAGFQPYGSRGGEMRHCSCGSTLLYVTYSKEEKHSYLPSSVVDFFTK